MNNPIQRKPSILNSFGFLKILRRRRRVPCAPPSLEPHIDQRPPYGKPIILMIDGRVCPIPLVLPSNAELLQSLVAKADRVTWVSMDKFMDLQHG